MKRSVALVLAIIIFAAIAVCFLRPAYPDWYFKVDGGTVTIVARPLGGRIEAVDVADLGEPTPIELEGDSELVQIAIEDFDMYDNGVLECKTSTTEEGREFISHVSIWNNGYERNLPIGYMECLSGERAGERIDISEGPHFLIIYPDGIYGAYMCAEYPAYVREYLSFNEPGRYRVVLYFYEYDSETETLLSEEPYEVSFELEYKIPETDISVFGATIDHDYTIMSKELMEYHKVNLLLYNNSGRRLYGRDIVLERKEGGRWTNCDDLIRNHECELREKNQKYDVCISKEAEAGDYRITIPFTEDWESDEVKYTATVYLTIDD